LFEVVLLFILNLCATEAKITTIKIAPSSNLSLRSRSWIYL